MLESEGGATNDYLVHYFSLPFYKGLYVVAISLFLMLFLLVFQPFGVSNYEPGFRVDLSFFVYMLGVAMTVMLGLAASEFILRPAIIKQATRGKLMAWIVWDYLFCWLAVLLSSTTTPWAAGTTWLGTASPDSCRTWRSLSVFRSRHSFF
jgi:hypothetical protein